jgi:hypothetical protein
MKREKEINVAEQAAIVQMRRWPTLYRNAMDYFLNCVAGSQGDSVWKDGLLQCTENERYVEGSSANGAKPKFEPYPFLISEEVAYDLLNLRGNFLSVSSCGRCPLDNMPDDMHKDWQDFISIMLFQCQKITPELYDTLVEAYCIIQYGMRENKNSNMECYKYDWKRFYDKIESYKARLRVILETQEKGKIPAYTYQGMGI